jgi:acetolactate synthase small subunit
MSLQSQETESSSRSQLGTHHFLIQAQPDPSVLSRVLELFALRCLLPTEVAYKRTGEGDGELQIHISVENITPEKAAHLATRMRNIIPVTRVVLGPAEC